MDSDVCKKFASLISKVCIACICPLLFLSCSGETSPAEQKLAREISELKQSIEQKEGARKDLEEQLKVAQSINAQLQGTITAYNKTIDTLKEICTSTRSSQEFEKAVSELKAKVQESLERCEVRKSAEEGSRKTLNNPNIEGVGNSDQGQGRDSKPSPVSSTGIPSQEPVLAPDQYGKQGSDQRKDTMLWAGAMVCTYMSAGACGLAVAAIAADLGLGGDEVSKLVKEKATSLEKFGDRPVEFKMPDGSLKTMTPNNLAELKKGMSVLKAVLVQNINGEVLQKALPASIGFNGVRFPSRVAQELAIQIAEKELGSEKAAKLRAFPPLNGK